MKLKTSVNYTPTQNLYIKVFKELPQCDLDKTAFPNLQSVLETLLPIEALIINARFGIGCSKRTLNEIATEYNTLPERIRTIERRALRKLGDSERAPHLRAIFS